MEVSARRIVRNNIMELQEHMNSVGISVRLELSYILVLLTVVRAILGCLYEIQAPASYSGTTGSM